MLERELWKRLPMLPGGGLPSLAAALDGCMDSAAGGPAGGAPFDEWVQRGNPWKARRGGAAACC